MAAIGALLDAVDAHVPVPERYLDAPFLMPIENVLTITGRGTVVTGAIERGTVRFGDPVSAVGPGRPPPYPAGANAVGGELVRLRRRDHVPSQGTSRRRGAIGSAIDL